MKIAKIMAMMKKGKSVTLMQQATTEDEESEYTGPQWISDGKAAYCLAGMPTINDGEEFFNAYDVNDKQRENFYFAFIGLPKYLQFERWSAGTVEAEPVKLTIGYNGGVIRPFTYGTQAIFIDTKYTEPFAGENQQYIEFAVRRDSIGTPFLCVFDGMEVQAAIYPVRFKESMGETLYNDLETFREELWREMHSTQAAKQQDAEQESMFGDDLDQDKEE